MINFASIFGRHEIDAWRDEQTFAAATALNQLAADLCSSFEEELGSAGWRGTVIAPGNFIATTIAPRVREAAEPVWLELVERANAKLKVIVQHQAVWNDTPRNLPESDDSTLVTRDIALAAVPLASGVAAAAALPALAVTTTTAFFGLVTTSFVSVPVVVVGGGLAGAAIATGLLNTSRIRGKAEERLRQRICRHVIAVLLKGSSEQPAILEQLTDLFSRTAQEAKRL